jgi:sulfoxide reductase heme-binding subunit YedZ
MFAPALKYLPWIGPDNRVSRLKLAIFVALFLPGLWVAYQFDQDLLGPRPLNQAIHEIGLWTIRLLLLSLAITPLRQMLRWPELILTRRMIGVAVFIYLLVHLFLYIADEKYNLLKVVSEIYLRIYLTIGFTALIGLAALAITSTDGMIARLGGKRWRRLHWLIYPIAVLGIVHFYMQAKADVWQPMWMTGLFAWLMAYRVLASRRKRGGAATLPWLAALALFAAAFTAVGEAVYFWALMGVDPLLILGANLGVMAGVRPSWIVLAAGLAVVLVAAIASAWRAWQRKFKTAPLGLRT